MIIPIGGGGGSGSSVIPNGYATLAGINLTTPFETVDVLVFEIELPVASPVFCTATVPMTSTLTSDSCILILSIDGASPQYTFVQEFISGEKQNITMLLRPDGDLIGTVTVRLTAMILDSAVTLTTPSLFAMALRA